MGRRAGLLCTSMALWIVAVLAFEEEGLLVLASRGRVHHDKGIITCIIVHIYMP